MLGLQIGGSIGECYKIVGLLIHDGDCIASVAGLLKTLYAGFKLLSYMHNNNTQL